MSKRYQTDYQPYWYAFHPNWDRFLSEGQDSYFILSCMDRNEAYAVPHSWINANKKNLNVTEKAEKLHIALTLDRGLLAINLSRIGKKVLLQPFAFSWEPKLRKQAKAV